MVYSHSFYAMETKWWRVALPLVLLSVCSVFNETESSLYLAFGFNYFERGNISTSTDQGVTWKMQRLLNFAPVMAFCFDSSNCYVITYNLRHFQVLVTSNTGNTWRTIALFKNNYGFLTRSGTLSCFRKSKCMFALGNIIGSTTDGFKHLNIKRLAEKNETEHSIQVTCLSENVCIATGKKSHKGIILRTNDWGIHWVKILVSPFGFQALSCVQSFLQTSKRITCVAVNEEATVLVSHDLGISWKKIVYNIKDGYFARQFFGESARNISPSIKSMFCPQPELCVLGFSANYMKTGFNITPVHGALCTLKMDSYKQKGNLKCIQLSHEDFSVSIHCVTPHHCLALHRNKNDFNSKCCSSQLHELDVDERKWVSRSFSPPVGRYPMLCGSSKDFTTKALATGGFSNLQGNIQALFLSVFLANFL